MPNLTIKINSILNSYCSACFRNSLAPNPVGYSILDKRVERAGEHKEKKIIIMIDKKNENVVRLFTQGI